MLFFSRGSQPGSFCPPPKGHKEMSRNITDCHHWNGGATHLVGRGRDELNNKDYATPNVSSAEVEKPCRILTDSSEHRFVSIVKLH